MKESFGTLGIVMIAVFFILLFGMYLSASINYAKAFKVKNEIINIIERRKGLATASGPEGSTLDEIYAYMSEVGYRSTGECEGDWDGYSSSSIADTTYTNPMICIKKVPLNSDNPEVPPTAYYKVRVFYSMDIPIFRSWFQFHVDGTSRTIEFPAG